MDDGLVFEGQGSRQNKYIKSQWENVEQQVPEGQQKVLRAMVALGTGETLAQGASVNAIVGDDYVTFIRPQLTFLPQPNPVKKAKGPVEEPKKKAKKGKKHQLLTVEDAFKAGVNDVTQLEAWVRGKNNGKISPDDIVKVNNLKKIVKEAENVEKTFNSANLKASSSFLSKTVEIRVAALMKVMSYLLETKRVKVFDVYEAIVAAEEVVKELKPIEDTKPKKEISEKLFEDIESLNDGLKAKVNFSHRTLCAKYPGALFSKKYKVLKSSEVRPYPSQTDFINAVKRNEEVLIRFVSMMGCGKTTTVVALAGYIMKVRQLEGKDTVKTQLLFICSDEPVRGEVCKALWNSNIPFGISVYKPGEGVAISYNRLCRGVRGKESAPDNCIALVADFESGRQLEQRPMTKFAVFVDEPTVGADQDYSPITKQLPYLMANSPPVTVLCSATLPKADDVPELMSLYTKRRPEAKVVTIQTSKTLIGTEVINVETGDLFLPHISCTKVEEIVALISRLEEKPILRRVYTPLVTYAMHDVFRDIVKSCPDIKEHYSDPGNYTQVAGEEFAIKLLRALVDMGDDAIVEKACKTIDYSEVREEKSGGKVASGKERYLDMITVNAYKYTGGTMLCTEDPMKLAKELHDGFLADLKLSDYTKETKAEQEKKRLRDAKPKKTKKGKKQEGQQEQEQEHENDDGIDDTKVLFPSERIINSSDHLRRYSAERTLPKDDMRTQVDIVTDIREIQEEDWLLLLLFSGIGVYQRGNNLPYSELVLRLASRGELAFILTDGGSMCYGTNYPITNVVVDSSIVNKHSVDTLFQLISRGGRVGKRSLGVAHVCGKFVEKIRDFALGPVKPPVEAVNIEKATIEFNDRIAAKERKKLMKNAEVDESKPISEPILVVNNYPIVSLGDVKRKASQMEEKPPPVTEQDVMRNTETIRRKKEGKYIPPALRRSRDSWR